MLVSHGASCCHSLSAERSGKHGSSLRSIGKTHKKTPQLSEVWLTTHAVRGGRKKKKKTTSKTAFRESIQCLVRSARFFTANTLQTFTALHHRSTWRAATLIRLQVWVIKVKTQAQPKASVQPAIIDALRQRGARAQRAKGGRGSTRMNSRTAEWIHQPATERLSPYAGRPKYITIKRGTAEFALERCQIKKPPLMTPTKV